MAIIETNLERYLIGTISTKIWLGNVIRNHIGYYKHPYSYEWVKLFFNISNLVICNNWLVLANSSSNTLTDTSSKTIFLLIKIIFNYNEVESHKQIVHFVSKRRKLKKQGFI